MMIFILFMSDFLKHECGVAVIRLLKPLAYYQEKYGSPLYGFNKLFLLMEKQHNRGQDGAGIGSVKLQVPSGKPYMFRERSTKSNALARIFRSQLKRYDKMVDRGTIHPEFPETVKSHFDFGGELLIGHLRYGTSGAFSSSACHPYFRRSNWPTRNLMLVGNFNMTNAGALNQILMDRGQHPIFDTDTQTVLEEIGFHLDETHTRIFHELVGKEIQGQEIQEEISRQLDATEVMKEAARHWDGGYVISGIIGNGDLFVIRDPLGIRPCYYFQDEEIVAFSSERVPLMSIFDKKMEAVQELEPGHIFTVKNDGRINQTAFVPPAPRKIQCSFERIYFSRGNDADIYRERKRLGGALASQILYAVEHDLEKTVISYVPNTAETAYYGLIEELNLQRRKYVKKAILDAHQDGTLSEELLEDWIMRGWARGEKVANKDIKLRTFIAQEANRSQMVSHVYDITYGIIRDYEDNLVCIDDSIVRGTTLKKSILKILIRTCPKKLVIASTAPQIRYPDCYGIDMSELGKFVAFQAAIALLKEQGRKELIQEVYQNCVRQVNRPATEMRNYVQQIYEDFTDEQISQKIAQLVMPSEVDWKGELQIIFQKIDSLLQACPNHQGDWYFTGNYPTPGGLKVLNQAFINYYENRDGRSYG